MNDKAINKSHHSNETNKLSELTRRLERLEIKKANIEDRIKEIKENHSAKKPSSKPGLEQRRKSKVIPIPSKYVRFMKRVCHDCDHNRIRIGDRVEFITHAAHQPREGTVAYFTEYRVTVEDDKGYKYSKDSCSLRVLEES